MEVKMMKFIPAMTMGAVLALGLTACGSTNDAGGGGAGDSAVNAPQSVIDLANQASQPQPWKGPRTSPPIAKGATVVSIPCGMAATGCARWDSGVHAAAQVLGWNVQTIDPALDPNKSNEAVHQAISLGAKAIVMISIDPALVANSVAAARKAGIVVVSAGAGWENEKLGSDTIQHEVSAHGTEQGEWTGATVCRDLGAKGDAMLFLDPQFKLVQQRIDGAQAALKKDCPGITTQVEQISAADLGTVLQSKASALLQANPNVKSIVVGADAFTSDFLVALQQVGLQNKVSVYSMDANPQVVQNIVDNGAVKGTVGVGLEWQGWATMDNVNRLLQGQPVNEEDGVPIRMVSKDFIPKDQSYTGDLDYAAAYTKLWTTGQYSE
jgi:ribose transport system substrate-binding protein